MSSSVAAPSYAAVLRIPHACRTFGAALLGRLSYGMVSLSLILAVEEATASYAVAGGVMAVFGLTSVFLAPARAGLVDRHGPRRILPPMAAAYAVLLSGLALATAWSGASPVLLGALAGAAGASAPPLGPVMRRLWSALVSDREMLQRAYSLDGVAEELLFVTGPLLVGVLVGLAAPWAGLAVSAALVWAGSLMLAASPAAGGPAYRGEAAPAAAPAGDVPQGATPGRQGVAPGLGQAIAVTAALGTSLGALDLLVIAFADERQASTVVPWVLAALSAGSAVGGLVHGTVRWRASSRCRLSSLALALGLVLSVTGLSPHPYVLIAWMALGGVFVAPAITTAYLIADECAAPGARTTAGAWVNTAFNAGSTGGTAAAGLLVGRVPLAVCFAVAAAPVVLSAATALTGRPDRGWRRRSRSGSARRRAPGGRGRCRPGPPARSRCPRRCRAARRTPASPGSRGFRRSSSR
ncbi:MFS transporter [Actinacidiphila glaucinigra]|uniref:MFS transporter n=1 Tax=Actinacidiphila glaucinigra TaxID=235986 RepID=UPI0036EF1260